MLFRRNLALQRRSLMKLLLLFGFPAWLSSPGFVYLLIFLSISKQVLDICKNVNLENTFKPESFPSCMCLPRSLPSSCYHLHAHTSCGWQESGCGGTHLEPAAPAWPIIAMGLVTTSCQALCWFWHCSHEMFKMDLRSWSLCDTIDMAEKARSHHSALPALVKFQAY